MSKVGRNDPCPCGSGKKYKKCCEENTKHKKLSARVLTQGLPFQPESQDTSKVSSMFFKRAVTQLNEKPTEPPEEIKNPVM
jgi:hypothetical protein